MKKLICRGTSCPRPYSSSQSGGLGLWAQGICLPILCSFPCTAWLCSDLALQPGSLHLLKKGLPPAQWEQMTLEPEPGSQLVDSQIVSRLPALRWPHSSGGMSRILTIFPWWSCPFLYRVIFAAYFLKKMRLQKCSNQHLPLPKKNYTCFNENNCIFLQEGFNYFPWLQLRTVPKKCSRERGSRKMKT